MVYRNVIAAALMLAAAAAGAEQRWVTDEFEVMMRSGKSNRQSIVRQLKSGTAVEVLETDAEAGYMRVRTASGTEGWVLSRYLRRSPTAKLQLPQVQQQLQASETEREKLAAELAELRRARRDLEREVGELQSSNSSQQNQLERITRLSADTIQVDQQNTQLKQRLAETEQQIETLQSENQRLASKANREWFLIGAAVLVAGLLLGLILPKTIRRKSSWSDF